MREFDQHHLGSKEPQLEALTRGRVNPDGTWSKPTPRTERLATLRSAGRQGATSSAETRSLQQQRTSPSTPPDNSGLIEFPIVSNDTATSSAPSEPVMPEQDTDEVSNIVTQDESDDPHQEPDKSWTAALARLLEREPTADEIQTCKRWPTGPFPAGIDDEIVATYVFKARGRLPTQADWEEADLGTANGGRRQSFKARIVRTAANPSARQIENSPELQIMWGPPIHEFIDNGIKEGFHHYMTMEEFLSGLYKLLDPIWVFKTKEETGVQKVRMTPHGGQEHNSEFKPHSLVASCPSMDSVKFFLAAAAFLDLKVVAADVENAYPLHNRMDDPACMNPRKIAVMLTPFQAKSDKPRLLVLDTITNGLKDASFVWNTISSRVMLQRGYWRSSGDPNFFIQHRGDQGLALVIKYVDDTIKGFSRNAYGEQMEDELEGAEKNAKWTMKKHSLDDAPATAGINFASIRIRKFDYGASGSGLALSQQRQLARLEEILAQHEDGSTAIKQVWCPVPKDYTLLASAALPAKADKELYARYMGALLWMQQTALHSPATSILASRTGNPSAMDAEFQVQLLRYYTGPAKELELHFYQGPPGHNILTVLEQHVFVDVGDCGAVDGKFQKARLMKMGPSGHPGGAFMWRSKKTACAESVPAGETETFNDSLKDTVRYRIMSEEIAGLRQDSRITIPRIIGSAPPTITTAPVTIVDDSNSTERGIWNCRARETVMRRFDTNPPTATYGDNEAVINVAIDGVGPATKIRGLAGHLREINNMHIHVENGIVKPVFTPSEGNIVDPLTKLTRSNVGHWDGLEGLLGPSPTLSQLRQEVHTKFDRHRRSAAAATHVTSEVHDNTAMFIELAPWLRSCNTTPIRIMQNMHFSGKLGAHEDGISEPVLPVILRARQGLGFAASATTITTTNNSIPDPESDIEGWTALLKTNTIANSGIKTVEDIESAVNYGHEDIIAIHWARNKEELEYAEETQRWAQDRINSRSAMQTLERRRAQDHQSSPSPRPRPAPAVTRARSSIKRSITSRQRRLDRWRTAQQRHRSQEVQDHRGLSLLG